MRRNTLFVALAAVGAFWAFANYSGIRSLPRIRMISLPSGSPLVISNIYGWPLVTEQRSTNPDNFDEIRDCFPGPSHQVTNFIVLILMLISTWFLFDFCAYRKADNENLLRKPFGKKWLKILRTSIGATLVISALMFVYVDGTVLLWRAENAPYFVARTEIATRAECRPLTFYSSDVQEPPSHFTVRFTGECLLLMVGIFLFLKFSLRSAVLIVLSSAAVIMLPALLLEKPTPTHLKDVVTIDKVFTVEQVATIKRLMRRERIFATISTRFKEKIGISSDCAVADLQLDTKDQLAQSVITLNVGLAPTLNPRCRDELSNFLVDYFHALVSSALQTHGIKVQLTHIELHDEWDNWRDNVQPNLAIAFAKDP